MLSIESQLPDVGLVPLNIPVEDCYYTGSVVGDGGSVVALSQCNDEMVMCNYYITFNTQFC